MANNLLPNTPNARPIKNRSQAYKGIPLPAVLAQWAKKFQPLPTPIGEPPFHYNLETSIPGIGQIAEAAGKIVFHIVGDTGPVITGDYLAAVVQAMANDLNKKAGEKPTFFYHLGDLVYNHGSYADYYQQFYKAYQSYYAPIFSIPGNHDADPATALQQSLDGWLACFMTKSPHIDPTSGDSPRLTMSLPNVYYTLECPYVNIVGLYTNVPEHGVVGQLQLQWFENELRTSPADKALIVCLHNPVYSFDNQHGGSPLMGEVLQTAINNSRRVPNMVFSAHVHNYQRIEKEISDGVATPFFVAGNGGYYILHDIIAEEGAVDEETGARLVKRQDKNHGYVQITVDAQQALGKSVVIDTITGNPDVFDSFSYPAGAMFLKENEVARL